jgi:ubiquinone/menaquinone biosynthesis C-methylase UbiE
MTAQDRWSTWLLEKRFGGNKEAAARGMRMLTRVRDQVLEGARLAPGATLLDVGCGDGLIGFGALDRVGPAGRVIFADVSAPLLERCAEIAAQVDGALSRCSFVEAPADDLRGIDDASVDAVTTRSVLIYVKDKPAAFREFHRVLKPGGWLSTWEPINRFNETYRNGEYWWGWDAAAPVRDLAQRIRDHFHKLQPRDTDPMLDFDEIDLVRTCEDAGFRRMKLVHEIDIHPALPLPWDLVMNLAGNPNIPSQREIISEIFTTEEAARWEACMRPIIEAGGTPQRGAVAHLTARKDGGPPLEEDA